MNQNDVERKLIETYLPFAISVAIKNRGSIDHIEAQSIAGEALLSCVREVKKLEKLPTNVAIIIKKRLIDALRQIPGKVVSRGRCPTKHEEYVDEIPDINNETELEIKELESKLTPEQKQVNDLLKAGHSEPEIEQITGLTRHYVRLIIAQLQCFWKLHLTRMDYE